MHAHSAGLLERLAKMVEAGRITEEEAEQLRAAEPGERDASPGRARSGSSFLVAVNALLLKRLRLPRPAATPPSSAAGQPPAPAPMVAKVVHR